MNSDLISRQDAIDAMIQLQDEDIEAYGCGIPEGFDGDRAVEALKALPSAEPEIIYCKDCKKHNMPHGHYYNGKYIGIKECCPLVFVRGLAQGHEFDYQFCAFGERREDG